MTSVPKSSGGHIDTAGLPVSFGDWVDPSRKIETINARWYFSKAIETDAPACMEELFTLDELMDSQFAAEGEDERREYVQRMTASLLAWCHKWNLDRVWCLEVALSTVFFRHSFRIQGIQHPPFFYRWADGPLIDPSEFSDYLERANPGWQDQSFKLSVPGMVFALHPTHHKQSELRSHIHKFLDDYLDELFADVESQVIEMGGKRAPKGKAAFIQKRHFKWAVRRIVLGHNESQIARDFNVQRGTIRSAVTNVRKAIELVVPAE